MSNAFTMFAKYSQEANGKVLEILNKLSNDEREKERGSYYHSLSGLVRHIGDAAGFSARLFRGALGDAPAAKALAGLEKIAFPEGALTETQWKQVVADLKSADQAIVDFASALTEANLAAPIKLDWFGGDPADVPLSFMFYHVVVAHGTHHRGQVSQILDELKIDNDYSGINVAFR